MRLLGLRISPTLHARQERHEVPISGTGQPVEVESMSTMDKIRAITVLSLSAAALAVLFAASLVQSRAPAADALAVCAMSKGARCEGLRDAAIRQDSVGSASVADLGSMTVIARRDRSASAPASIEGATFLGAMIVTAPRLPNTWLARAASESGAPQL